jgi:hypothetical protein
VLGEMAQRVQRLDRQRPGALGAATEKNINSIFAMPGLFEERECVVSAMLLA